MSMQFVCESRLRAFLSAGDFAERFATVPSPTGPRYQPLNPQLAAPLDLRSPRSADSIRAMFMSARAEVATYGPEARPAAPAGTARRLVAGVRACDLAALAFLDAILLQGEWTDPHYRAARERTFLICVDCVQPYEKCFCTALGGAPYAEDGFDVNLTPLSDGYAVRAGSPAGQEFLAAQGALLEPLNDDHQRQRQQVRQAAAAQLEQSNAGVVPAIRPQEGVAAPPEPDAWDICAADCVECGACTQICPTCHCFYLWDQPAQAGGYRRLRAWDSCLFSGYWRMAGVGGVRPNPHARFRARLANRLMHKYVWSVQQWGRIGCVGCGRCSEACLGGIDIRQAVREMTRCPAKR